MKKLATVAVIFATVSFQNAKAQKIFDKLDRLSDRVDNASYKVDRAGNAVDRAGNTASRAGETGAKIVSLFKKKNQEPAKDATEDKNKNKPKKKE